MTVTALPLHAAGRPVDVVRPALPPFERGGVATASTRDRTLVVWRDHRSGTDAVFATFVDRRSGAALSPFGMRISQGEVIDRPTVIAIDDQFVVAWSEFQNDVPVTYLATVASDGSTRLGQAQPLSGANPRLAWNGSRLAVGTNSSAGVQIAFFDRELRNLVEPQTMGRSAYAAAITTAGNNFVVIDAGLNMTAQLFDEAGNFISLNVIAETVRGVYQVADPQVINVDDRLLVTWTYAGEVSYLNRLTQMRVLDVDGTPRSPTIFTLPDDGPSTQPQLVRQNGATYVVYAHGAAGQNSDIRRREVTSLEPLSVGEAETIVDQATNYSIVAAGDQAYVAYTLTLAQGPATRAAIFGRFIHEVPQLLSYAPRMQRGATAVATRRETVVAWSELRGGVDAREQIVFRRLRNDGSWIESEPVPVVASSHDQTNVVAAWSGETTMLVWLERLFQHNQAIVRAALISADGHVFKTFDIGATGYDGPILDFSPQISPAAVASRDGNFIVVWQDEFGISLLAQRFGTYGLPIDPSPVTLTTDGVSRLNPQIVTTTNGYALAFNAVRPPYSCRINECPNNVATEVAAMGNMPGPLQPIEIAPGDALPPVLVSTGSDAVVFANWTEYDVTVQTVSQFVRIDESGNVVERRDLPGSPWVTSAQFDGSRIIYATRDTTADRVFAAPASDILDSSLLWVHDLTRQATVALKPTGDALILFEDGPRASPFWGVSRLFYDDLSRGRTRAVTITP